MLKRDIIEDLAILLRGFFATPMISSLGRLGVLEKMGSATSFRLNDFPDIQLQAAPRLNSIFSQDRLVERTPHEEVYKASELGKEIFRRANSFYVRIPILNIWPLPGLNHTSRRNDQMRGGTIRECYWQRKNAPAVFSARYLFLEGNVTLMCGGHRLRDGQFLLLSEQPAGEKVVGIDLQNNRPKPPTRIYGNAFLEGNHGGLFGRLDVAKWSKRFSAWRKRESCSLHVVFASRGFKE